MEQFKLNWTGAEVNDAITRINNLFNLIYPVGSIYMSVNNTSPATLFGGTWVQIKDTFLLACGDTYANAATGGSAIHSHNYGLQYGGYYTDVSLEANTNAGLLNYSSNNSYSILNSTSSVATYTTAYNSGNTTATVSRSGSEHYRIIANTSYTSTLPPYLSVYVWKRTA